jgi:hypothetical protein
MKNILPKELKIKFVESLKEVDSFSYEDGNPFLMKIGTNSYFIFLKNLSPAYFVNSPDVTRVQLPYSEHFAKIIKANIPFLILGYDVDNDVMVCWNPSKVKERLNAKSNVSLYARASLQLNIKRYQFKDGFLSNGEKIIIFKRESLNKLFDNLEYLFSDGKSIKTKVDKKENVVISPKKKDKLENIVVDNKIDTTKKRDSDEKLYEIRDKALLKEIKPLLKKNNVLEAVEVCTKFYEHKYEGMVFKDWFNLVKELYNKIEK